MSPKSKRLEISKFKKIEKYDLKSNISELSVEKGKDCRQSISFTESPLT